MKSYHVRNLIHHSLLNHVSFFNFLFLRIINKISKLHLKLGAIYNFILDGFLTNSDFFSKRQQDINLNFANEDFITSIIHELKTPLNAIVGFSEVLKEDVRNPKMKQECLDYAKEISLAANDLNELIHDLLDVGSIASGNFSVDLSKEIDVEDVIKRSVRINFDYALKRKVNIKTEIADDVCAIRLDSRRMKQIMTNLISNAVKYSPEKTEVKIYAKNVMLGDKKHLQITISDQGFGMTENEVATAFEKYQTISNPNSGKVDSFGLGLPITKQLVELQKGTIAVKSQINKGTEVTIKFPYN